MNHTSLFLKILFLCVLVFNPGLLISCGLQSSAATEKATVTTVYDGDTIRVRFEDGRSEVVRLIGINAPELSDKRETVHFLAQVSKRFAFTHLYRQDVKLEFDWEARDRYGRILAYVFFEKGNFNAFIIREGFAAAFLKYPFKEKYRRMFSTAEREARDLGRGMWSDGEYPLAVEHETESFVGRIVRIEFVCSQVEKRGRFWFLLAKDRDFAALINQRERDQFDSLDSLTGKTLTVTGFLELYRGQPQIHIFLPSQIIYAPTIVSH